VLNSSESALEHLVEAPFIVLIVGFLGVGLARFRRLRVAERRVSFTKRAE